MIICDLSHWQSISNWNALKENAGFLIFKATEGLTYIDPTFSTNADMCEHFRIPYFAYVYLRRGGSEPEQVQRLIDLCQSYNHNMLRGVALDVEDHNEPGAVKTALRVAEMYASLNRKKVLLYTGFAQYTIYKSVINSKSELTAWWEARYGVNDGIYHSNAPCHTGVDLHQYTSKGRVYGIHGFVDMNRLTGSKPLSWFTGTAEIKPQKPGSAKNDLGLYYRAHVQTYGTLDPVHDGQICGTANLAKRFEALWLDFRKINQMLGFDLDVDVIVNIAKNGQTVYKHIQHDTRIGTEAEKKAIESVIILPHNLPDSYRLKYELYVQSYGWLGAVEAGQCAGSQGMAKRAEAFRAWLEKV